MATETLLSLSTLEETLKNDPDNIGCLIGWVHKEELNFLVYLGGNNFLKLYDGGSEGKKLLAFEYLKVLVNKEKIEISEPAEFVTFDDLESFATKDDEFYKYEYNIVRAMSCGKSKPLDVLENLKHNLDQIQMLENGDVINFRRSLYNHTAVLVDKVRLICVHRSGEPNLGMVSCIDKAVVTKDHLIDIASESKLTKSNHIFDKYAPPKPIEEIVKEANRRVGEIGYSLASMNCQHFASEVRNGSAISPEVEVVKVGSIFAGAALVTSLIGMVACVFIDSRTKSRKEENKQLVSRK